MEKLTHQDLFSLEQYARMRNDFRTRVMEHKLNRRLPIGEHAALYFEDRLTMQYHVQEMLRLERMFEPEQIQEELNVYNPLIPDGHNWKATFMLEYEDQDERRRMLSRLVGIEKTVWMKVEGFDPIRPICNEDLERSNDDKTASVHFMRFELTPNMVSAVKDVAPIQAGIDHPEYTYSVVIPNLIRDSLSQDLR